MYPEWLKKDIYFNQNTEDTNALLAGMQLHTVCMSARCPNKGECFSRKTAAFLLLGNICTRRCSFCAVPKGDPFTLVNHAELGLLLQAVNAMKLLYVVLTSVTRDDLPDGGALHFSNCITLLYEKLPDIIVEVLIPDFNGSMDSLDLVLAARPHVLNHNIETVPSLYNTVRPGADYDRSLRILSHAKKKGAVVTKSGLMLGLGEKEEELFGTLRNLVDADCDMVTIGQYLQPGRENIPVKRFIPPEEFVSLKEYALSIGFKAVEAGPFVRSSYRAQECYTAVQEIINEKNTIASHS